MQQQTCHTRTVIIVITNALKDSDEEVILVSDMHELLSKIYDILDKGLCKWVGNTVGILASFLIQLPGKSMESGLYSSVLFIVLRTLPPSDACPYDYINWSLPQVQQQPLSSL